MTEEERERLLRFSLLYFKRGELKKASSTCEQILAAFPDDPTALELMGDIKLTLGELEEALSFYKRAKENNPSSDEVEKKIGRTALRIAEERGEFELKSIPIKKLPTISGLLSLIFAGLGQLYNGDIGKGVAGIILSTLFLAIPLLFKQPWFFLVWIFLNFGFALEAYYTASKMSKKEDGS